MRRTGFVSLGMVVLAGVVGCSDDSPTEPTEPTGGTFIVDASDTLTWALVDLGTTPTTENAEDPSTEAGWDLAFQKTQILVNGGAGGPGEVATYCVCQNVGATDEDYQAMTPDTELADFEAVTSADIPSESAWDTGTTADGVFGTSAWYKYNLQGQHHIWPTFDVYLVRSGSEVFKVQITNYYDSAGESRHYTFRYASLSE